MQLDDAPVWYGGDDACAWVCGYNKAIDLAQSRERELLRVIKALSNPYILQTMVWTKYADIIAQANEVQYD